MSLHRRIFNYIKRYPLLLTGLAINLLFCYSALWTHWLDFFFSGSSLHLCCQGLDFYQIPNGFHFFQHGGSLAGKGVEDLENYSTGSMINGNVYHPLLTIILGSFFLLFQPNTSFYVWMAIKCAGTLLLAGVFYWRFRHHKYSQFAAFLLLASFPQYLEVRISQYQFLFNVFALLCLMDIVSEKTSWWSGLWYGLSILIKPLSLLWLPLLLWKRQYRTAIGAILVVCIATLPFLWNHTGDYYLYNIIMRLQFPIIGGPVQTMTLDALLRYTISAPEDTLRLLKYGSIAGVMALSLSRKIPLLTGIFGIVVVYLLFFDFVFEYYYATIPVLLAICTIGVKDFQRPQARFLSLLACAPSCLFLFRLWNIHIVYDPVLGPDPTPDGWKFMALGYILPIIALAGFTLSTSVKQVLLALITFLKENSVKDTSIIN